MERPVSARHAPMRRCDRAAQFAPFAALSGFGEAVQEAGRLARERIESAERSDKLPDDAFFDFDPDFMDGMPWQTYSTDVECRHTTNVEE